MNLDEQVTMFQQLISERDEAVRQRNHWKANHDEVVKKYRMLHDRPDLPAERVKSHQDAVKQIERLQEGERLFIAKVTNQAEEIDRLGRQLKEKDRLIRSQYEELSYRLQESEKRSLNLSMEVDSLKSQLKAAEKRPTDENTKARLLNFTSWVMSNLSDCRNAIASAESLVKNMQSVLNPKEKV